MLLSKMSIWKYRTEILKTNLTEKLGYALESNLKLNLKPILIVENQLFSKPIPNWSCNVANNIFHNAQRHDHSINFLLKLLFDWTKNAFLKESFMKPINIVIRDSRTYIKSIKNPSSFSTEYFSFNSWSVKRASSPLIRRKLIKPFERSSIKTFNKLWITV